VIGDRSPGNRILVRPLENVLDVRESSPATLGLAQVHQFERLAIVLSTFPVASS